MSLERHVKLFRNGRNQAVRIPREFELPGEDAIIRKEGDRLIIGVSPPRSLLAVLASLSSRGYLGWTNQTWARRDSRKIGQSG
jgi:antitoxin VapB